MYPTDKCYFCNHILYGRMFDNNRKQCDDSGCYSKYHYMTMKSGPLKFKFTINNYSFAFEKDGTMTCSNNGNKYKFPQWLLVDESNYLEVFSRIKELQTFK